MKKIYFVQRVPSRAIYQIDLSIFLESSHYESIFYTLTCKNSPCRTASELYDLLCVLLAKFSGYNPRNKTFQRELEYFNQAYSKEFIDELYQTMTMRFRFLSSTLFYYNLNPHVYGVNR